MRMTKVKRTSDVKYRQEVPSGLKVSTSVNFESESVESDE